MKLPPNLNTTVWGTIFAVLSLVCQVFNIPLIPKLILAFIAAVAKIIESHYTADVKDSKTDD